MKNYIVPIILVIVALVAGVIIGYATHGNGVTGGAASPTGTTQSSPQLVQTTFSAVSTTTFATFYNNGVDRVVKSIYYYVPTLGASVTIQIATSTNSIDLNSNTNYLLNQTMVSTTPYYTSTSTSVTGSYRLWTTGTYLNAVSSATTTGGGVIGLDYFNE